MNKFRFTHEKTKKATQNYKTMKENMKNSNQLKKESPKLQRPCQYNYPGCQKVTEFQHILKLGVVTIQKSWICDNCYQQLPKERQKN